MNQIQTEELVPDQNFDVDVETMQLLEEDLNAIQGVRSFKSPLLLIVEDLANKVFVNKFTTSIVVAVMLSCLAQLVWNAYFRIPDDSELSNLLTENEELIELKEYLKSQVVAFDQIDLEEQLEVESSRVFAGFPMIATWINELVSQAEQHSMDMTYRIETPKPAQIEGVLEVPVVLEFSAQSGAKRGVFESSMKLLSIMLADRWHLDIASTVAKGDSQGLSRLAITIKLWVIDNEGFTNQEQGRVPTVIYETELNEEIIQ
ncbi:MAG: hypothetical protein KTR35_23340 [Gammaproteobacteria bacterium]|nr:hypothetical protein [Gammaproteobacteria bacterium]